MKIKGSSNIGILLLLFLTACVDDYWPKLDKFENLLVVDGMITNAPGPYVVKLSLSSEIRSSVSNPVSQATVVIREKIGISEKLTEIENGVYSTAINGIRGIPGHKYRIEIETEDGKTYQSSYDLLQEPVLVDNVYAEIETRPGGGLPHDRSGFQFYVDSKPAGSDTSYLMWLLEATYEYKADLKVRFVFDGTLHEYTGLDSLETCWRTYRVPKIFTAQTAGLAQNKIVKFPLHYVDTETRELYIRYSVLADQFTLGKKAWNYWNNIRRQNEEQGGLYSQQPYQIRGNVFNPSDPEEMVLGRFTVAGISQQRLFVDKPNLPFWFSFCEVTEPDIENFGTIFTYPPQTWPVYATTTAGGVPALPNQDCMDCRKRGGTTRRPDFWTDQ